MYINTHKYTYIYNIHIFRCIYIYIQSHIYIYIYSMMLEHPMISLGTQGCVWPSNFDRRPPQAPRQAHRQAHRQEHRQEHRQAHRQAHRRYTAGDLQWWLMVSTIADTMGWWVPEGNLISHWWMICFLCWWWWLNMDMDELQGLTNHSSVVSTAVLMMFNAMAWLHVISISNRRSRPWKHGFTTDDGLMFGEPPQHLFISRW